MGVLDRLDEWEASLVRRLRLWCEGPRGQEQILHEYLQALPAETAQTAYKAFDSLLRVIISNARRPLVRHDVECSCLGADESAFLHLVGFAADRHHSNAALMAALIAGPGNAEKIALLAHQVGVSAREVRSSLPDYASGTEQNVVRLH